MIDPRYFPFRNWYSRYVDFNNGKNVDSFIKDNPFEVFSMQYGSVGLLNYFLNLPDWRPAFYGPSGPVFVKKNIPLYENRLQRAHTLGNIRNVFTALYTFSFALKIRDFNGAVIVYNGMKRNFSNRSQNAYVIAAENVLKGTLMFYRRKYDEAMQYFNRCAGIIQVDPDILSAIYYYSAVDAWSADNPKAALKQVQSALSLKRDDLHGTFNLGVIKWWINKHYKVNSKAVAGVMNPEMYQTGLEKEWRGYLNEFIEKSKGLPGAHAPINIARQILNGAYKGKPPLIYPPEPVLAGK